MLIRRLGAVRGDVRLLAASALFDRDWYLEQNPDVGAAGIDPLRHYLRYGADEGRDPNPLFDSDWYIEQNPDVRAAGYNPLVHYLKYGAAEGRQPNAQFDARCYLDRYPEIRAAGGNPLSHYLQHRHLPHYLDSSTNQEALTGEACRISANAPAGREWKAISHDAESREIAIVDDLFPQPLSQFRFEEFASYLDLLPNLRVFADGRTLRDIGETRSVEVLVAEHIRDFPRHAGRILPLSNGALPDGAAAYALFMDNVHFYLDQIEQRRMPFGFTLYPRGGFRLDQPRTDQRLARIFGSPWFRYVIATQPIARDYLLGKQLCPPERIAYIFGCVVPRSAFDPPAAKARFGLAKKGIDICFVAARYSPTGSDKGYDLFVEAAKRLCAAGVDARFHVVGNYDPTIIDLGTAASRFTFYGYRLREFFREFYHQMDLMLAPNHPPFRRVGIFDGFPTTTCVEAGLQEVAVLCTDELRQNRSFADGRDIVIVQPTVNDVMDRLMQLIGEPERIAAIGESGRRRMNELYCSDVQIRPRVELLRSLAAA